ncbi:DUF1934 domain-containing protein [Bacillus andreraoultii]|uniref:DUF1934 domain-containing protein n=1 Tax=Bacillus andreraoultii TaxID=1499685 RepID=UPI00053B779A|nr:DUF1934 domain-containing protein [Bacillus andreraoultii]
MKTAGTPVKINLQTKIDRDGQKEDFELIVFGQFYIKNQSSYLIFDEIWEKGKVHTIVKHIVQQDGTNSEVQVLRRGAMNMRLFFKENELMSGTYKTDVGTFTVETSTVEMDYHWNEEKKSGEMKVNYHFFIEQIEVGTYELKFTFEAVSEN